MVVADAPAPSPPASELWQQRRRLCREARSRPSPGSVGKGRRGLTREHHLPFSAVLETELRTPQDVWVKYAFLIFTSAVYIYGFSVVGISDNEPRAAGSFPFPHSVVTLLFLAFPCALAGGYLAVFLLRTRPHTFLYAACAWASLAAFASGVYVLTQGDVGSGVVIVVISVWNAYVLYSWHQGGQLDLVARLLSTACVALADNSGLVTFSAALLLAVVILVLVPLLGFAVAAAALPPHATRGVFYLLASLALTWACGTASEVQLYTTAHVVARWYEQPAGVRLEGRPVSAAARLAATHGLGSCAAAGAVLTAVECVRELLRRLKTSPAAAIVLDYLESLFLRWVVFLTRFNTVRCAVAGEPFREAGRASQALLSRNGCDARAACYLVPIVLNVVSAGGAVTAAIASRILFALFGSAAPGWGAAVFWLTFAIAFAALSFLCGLLQSVVDVLYYMYVHEKEAGRSTRGDVVAIMAECVAKTQSHTVVQQPDGELGYGGGGGARGRVQTRAEWLNS